MEAPAVLDWFVKAFSTGELLLVADGSFKPNQSLQRGAAAWIITTEARIYEVRGALSSTMQTANAYRSELTGLYAVLGIFNGKTPYMYSHAKSDSGYF